MRLVSAGLLALALGFPTAGAQEVPLVVADDLGAAYLPALRAEYDGDAIAFDPEGALDYRLDVSSHLASQRPNHYHAGQAEDGEVTTAWVEGVRGPGIGEHLIVRFGGHPVGGVSVSGFFVVNGYAKDAETWRANGRVRELLVTLNERPVARVRLHDTMNPQWTRLPADLYADHGDTLTLEIQSVYPGTQHEDTAVAEFQLHGGL